MHSTCVHSYKEWCTRPKESCLLSRDCSLYMNNQRVYIQGKIRWQGRQLRNVYMYYAMCGIQKMAYKVIYRKCLQNKLHSISFPLFLSWGWGPGTRLPCQEWTIWSEQRGKEKVCDSVDLWSLGYTREYMACMDLCSLWSRALSDIQQLFWVAYWKLRLLDR